MHKLTIRNCLLVLFFLIETAVFSQQNIPRPTQYVCVAFDGSYSLKMWDATMNLALEASTPQKAVHFTYFINSVYFLQEKWRKAYVPPVGAPGTSAVDFAETSQDIQERVLKVNAALAQGHEIGSHTAGHRSGNLWTEAQWQKEFNEFNNLLFNYALNNKMDQEKAPRLSLSPQNIVGFRAPSLAINDAMYEVLRKNNFIYDTSRVIDSEHWPVQEKGLWIFGVPLITHMGTKPLKRTLAMDYNFFLQDTRLKTVHKYLLSEKNKAIMMKRYGTIDPDLVAKKLEDDCYASLKIYFEKNYYGKRAPIHIGFHFSLFGDGLYWRALQRFVKDVAARNEVQVLTYKELCAILTATPPKTHDSWKNGHFEKYPSVLESNLESKKDVRSQN